MNNFVFIVTKEMKWWESGIHISTNVFNTKEKAIDFAKKELSQEVIQFLKSYNKTTVLKEKDDWTRCVITSKDSYTVITIDKMEVK